MGWPVTGATLGSCHEPCTRTHLMTVWTFFAAWELLVFLWIGLSYAWARLRSLEHPVNRSLDRAFAGPGRVLEYALLVGIAVLMTWGALIAARPWWSEPTAPIHAGKPVVFKLHPDSR